MDATRSYRSRHERVASDPVAIGLEALAWIVADAERGARLLALTGLDPAALRARASEPALLAAAIGFLEGREADLLACAEALTRAPGELVAAREALEA